tara:strand:- start:2508 stop:3647 length:1140 start_codon:yes stop_codon:yes gene_type:complete
MSLLRNSNEIYNLCNKLKNEKFICIDTEFIREKYYYPKLCLIQIGDSKGNGWAIDPLIDKINLEPIYKLFTKEKIIKVFHSPRQDFEIIFNLTNKIPKPIFDTQSAAMACGYGNSVSYEKLVKDIIGINLNKSLRYTNWQKRPLSNQQIKYAISDVTHLSKIYLNLIKNIETNSRKEWIKEEINSFYNKKLYFTKPYDAWKKIKFNTNNLKTISIIREIAANREKLAQKLNIPKNKVIKDEIIVKIAKNPPKNIEAFKSLRGINLNYIDDPTKNLVIKSINIGLKKDNKNLIIKKNKNIVSRAMIEVLKIILLNAAEKNNISSLLIANKEDIKNIAMGKRNTKALKGWRYEIFGFTALKFMQGKASIKISKGNIVIEQN